MPKSSSPPTPRRARRSEHGPFLPRRALAAHVSPDEFHQLYSQLIHLIRTAQKDLRTLLRARGWQAQRARGGPLARFVKTFPDNRQFRLSEKAALRLEDSFCTAVACFEA